MTTSAPARAATDASRSNPTLAARLAGVVLHPRRTLQAVAARPHAAGVLLVAALAGASAGAGLMTTTVGRQALVDQWERTAIAFGRPVDDAQYAQWQAWSDYGVAYAAGAALAAGPGISLVAAGLIATLMNRGLQRRSFRQVLAVAAHAGVILALRQVVSAPLNYMRETTASPTALGVWFPMLDEASPAARMLGMLDGFVLWWLVVLAIGIAVLFDRRPTRVAGVLILLYAAFALVLALTMAAFGGTA